MLTVEADSDLFYRSSEIPLDGASAPRTFFLTYPDLPEGRYLIEVALSGDRGTITVSRQYVEVRPD